MILLPVETRQEAKSHGQSLQETIYRTHKSQQEARDRRQSRRKPVMTDSLCRYICGLVYTLCSYQYFSCTRKLDGWVTVIVISQPCSGQPAINLQNLRVSEKIVNQTRTAVVSIVGDLFYWALDRFWEECSETGDINELSPLTSISKRSK